MGEAAQMDYFFNFKFNLHKSLLPIGIDDHDYKRLEAVYGVDEAWMQQAVETIAASNRAQAAQLATRFDLRKLDAKPLKIAFFGDSITSDRQSYLNVLKTATAEFVNLTLVDMAISAHKSGDLFTALYPGMIGEHADIAHIMIGTNDVRQMDDAQRLFHTSPEEYEKNVDYVVSQLVQDGTQVILTTIPPFCEEKVTRGFAGCRALFCEQSRVLFNGILERIAARHGVLLNRMDTRYAPHAVADLTLDDGIHLNAAGQALLAQGVVDAIMQLVD